MNEQDPVNDYGHFPKIVVDFSYILHQLFFFWLPSGFVSTLQHATDCVSLSLCSLHCVVAGADLL